MLTSASFAYTIKYFHAQCWDLGGLGSRRSFTTVVNERNTVVNRIFVEGAWARRGRWNDHSIDAGSITAVVF